MRSHVCPVRWSVDHGRNGSVNPGWCFDALAPAVRDLPADAGAAFSTGSRLLLYADQALEIFYAPVDAVNTSALITLVGITPGCRQAWVALRAAQAALLGGCSAADALASAKATAAFAGSMRTNLVRMLDGIGIPTLFGLASSAALFAGEARLAQYTSAVLYPVFRRGRNYAGRRPPLGVHPLLRDFVRGPLAANLALTPNSLVIPFGTAAEAAVMDALQAVGADRSRCLSGFPHPSGANPSGRHVYSENRVSMTDQVSHWTLNR